MNSRKLFAIALTSFLLLSPIAIAHAQKVESKDRDRGLIMLDRIKDELKKHYYDPNFRGMNLDVRFKTASEKIKEAASVGQIFGTTGRDTVLAYAASLGGVTLDPVEAGKFFPLEIKKKN